jgi:hypothetical protein
MMKKKKIRKHTSQIYWDLFKPKICSYLLSVWFALFTTMFLIEGKSGPLEKTIPKIIFSSSGIMIAIVSFLPPISHYLRLILLRPDIDFDDDVRFVFKLVGAIGLAFTIPLFSL